MKTRSAAHLAHGEFEGELGAQRRLLEEHGDGLAVERVPIVRGDGLTAAARSSR